MSKLIVVTIIIVLTAIGFSGCAVYPNYGYGYGSHSGYQGRPSWGYQNYGNSRGYGTWGYGNQGYGHHEHHHGGHHDDD